MSAGVRIDAYALRKLLDELSLGYDSLLSCKIKMGDASLAAPAEPTPAPAAADEGGDLMGLASFLSMVSGPAAPEPALASLDQVPLSVDWLFNLRSSELFLALWRQLGTQVLRESVAGAVDLLEGRGGAAEEDIEVDDEDPPMPQIPEELMLQARNPLDI